MGAVAESVPASPPDPLHELVHALGTGQQGWTDSLGRILGRPVQVRAVQPDHGDGLKRHGMTRSVRLVVADPGGATSTYFVKVPDEELYGETLRCDRARELVWRLEGYPAIPGHVVCRHSARITPYGLAPLDPVQSAPAGATWCVLEPAVSGVLLADRLADLDPAVGGRDAELLAGFLARLHQPVPDDGRRYRRSLRDTLMNATFRLLDSSMAYWDRLPAERERIEHHLARWRIRLSGRVDRLRRTHNDFHPWNIFLDGDRVRVVGARLPGMGDPADDLAALLVNYLWFSLRRCHRFTGCYLAAYREVWRGYQELTGDAECAAVFPPFLAKRLLVILNPVYYPDQPEPLVRALTALTLAVLAEDLDALNDPASIAEIVGPIGDGPTQ